MASKFIVLFDKQYEVEGIAKAHVFNSPKDAESFFETYSSIIEFEVCDGYFTFKTLGWSGAGKCFYATVQS